MYHAARTTTCRLCEYQCYVAGNNALHSIAVDSAWWLNAACQATIVNNSRSGAQGISTNVALPKGGLLGYNALYITLDYNFFL